MIKYGFEGRPFEDYGEWKDLFSEYIDDTMKYQRELNKKRSKMLHILNNEGEKKVIKIILKNIETGIYHYYPVEKEWESEAKKLKVGQIVQYHHKNGMDWETCKVEKIIDNKPKAPKGAVLSEFASTHFKPFPWQMTCLSLRGADNLRPPFSGLQHRLFCYPRGAGKTTLTKQYLDDCRQIRLEHKEVEKYNKKPYFLARLDTIKGKPDGKENLEKMMFPCYVIWKANDEDTDKLGQLVTGFTGYPYVEVDYQLINLSSQVPVKHCCTVDRDKDLKELMERWHIEVIKGEAQLWKVGSVNV